jgi:hypothetical protein
MSVDGMSEDEISSYAKSVDFLTLDAIKTFLFVVQRPSPIYLVLYLVNFLPAIKILV